MYRLRNRVFFAFDLVAWALIPAFAVALRLDFGSGVSAYGRQLAAYTAVGLVCKFSVLWVFGLYRRFWRYASIDELMSIIAAVTVAGIATAGVYFLAAAPLLSGVPRLPRSVPITDAVLTLMLFGGSRFAVRAAERLRQRLRDRPGAEPVLIVGAGEAGALVAKELRANPQLNLEPVGFVDDDPLKQGRFIQGLPVLGGRARIAVAARDYKVRQAIIAMPRIPGKVVREIRDLCEAAGLRAKTIPGMFDIISGRVRVNQIRDVQIEDLLRREPVVTDQAACAALVRGTTVLVTGAGGSIGSEICRQAAHLGARELVLLDHGENAMFDIHSELSAQRPGVRLIPVIGDIRNRRRVGWAFETYRPKTVFHAAAHKHVPLMEWNPCEAVTNNVGGTMNVLEAAEQSGVKHFVLISTDKAVNPTNVMGATKLVAETLVHEAAARTGRHYVSVRFGNVLDSRGSVVPTFRQQIAAGGPVTVTHPDMCRYFMTIPEAVQLVLQAAALGVAGETFVLDMGEPVKIMDLAKDLIRLSGLEVGKDIEIEFTGLRPGEKLFEELFLPIEQQARTRHEKIFVARNGAGRALRSSAVTQLVAAAEGMDRRRVAGLLSELVPEFAGRGVDLDERPGAGASPAGAPLLRLRAVELTSSAPS